MKLSFPLVQKIGPVIETCGEEFQFCRLFCSRAKSLQPKFSQSHDASRLTHLALGAKSSITSREIWRPLRDSNPRPQD
jgi:hypothetical protein